MVDGRSDIFAQPRRCETRLSSAPAVSVRLGRQESASQVIDEDDQFWPPSVAPIVTEGVGDCCRCGRGVRGRMDGGVCASDRRRLSRAARRGPRCDRASRMQLRQSRGRSNLWSTVTAPGRCSSPRVVDSFDSNSSQVLDRGRCHSERPL